MFYDQQTLSNSVFLLDLSNIDSVRDYLELTSLTAELYFHLLSKIGNEDNPLNPAKYVLIKKELENKESPIWSCIAMHVIKEGQLVYSPYIYDLKPQVSSHRQILSGRGYQQFNDSIIILSEYNDQKDILDKYLRLYHVIENFMYKYPLVKLERNHNGAVFSIRDFQRMFDKISSNEITALTKLIKRVCDEFYMPGARFSNLIIDKWQAIHPEEIPDILTINSLLKRLRISKKEDADVEFADLNVGNIISIPKLFSNIIYAFRNSLVHNRETEFHLTHETLLNHPEIGDTARTIIEKFLIPVMEEIVYFLIIDQNDIVWFQNSNLNLYNEN